MAIATGLTSSDFRRYGTSTFGVALFDGLYTDATTLGLRSVSQTQEIQKLKRLLEEKNLKRANDLKSIIGYFYKR